MAVRARRHDRQRPRYRAHDRLHVDLAGRFRPHQYRSTSDHPRLFAQRHGCDLRPDQGNAAALQENADARIAQRVDQFDAVALDHHPRHGDAGVAGAVAFRRQRHSQLHRGHDVRRGAGRYLHLDLHRCPDPDLSRRRHPSGCAGKTCEEVTMPGRPDAPHLPRSAPIEAYGNGGFAFAEMSHRGSLLCLPDAIWAWPVTRPEDIDKASLDRVFAAAKGIDTLLMGTGTDVWLPPSDLREALRAVRVVLDAMQTGPAVRTYNIMIGERRRVAAALIAVP